MQPHYVDWKEPFLTGVVRQILHGNTLGAVKEGSLDLSDFIFVFPSGLAGRSFEEKLARETEKLIREKRLRSDWLPPKVVIPVGEFPEHLYTPEKPFAEKPALLLAWRAALDAEEGPAKTVFPNLPDKDDFAGRLDTASYLARLHNEVATEGSDFSSPQKYVKENVPEEVVRWDALCAVEKEYYAALESWCLCDKQKERLNAVGDGRVHTDKTVVLVGTVDLNGLQKKILEKVKDRVVLFIQASEEASGLFDEYGCVNAEAWENHKIPIPCEEAIVAAPDAIKEGEFAACYTHRFGAEGETFKRGKVAISLLDPAARPYLSEKLEELGIEAHFGEGKPFASGRVALLLRGAADYLRTGSYEDFAAWIRHADVETAFLKQGDKKQDETLSDGEKMAPADRAESRDGASACPENGQRPPLPAGGFTAYDQYQNRYIPQTVAFSEKYPFGVLKVFKTLLGISENQMISPDDLSRKAPLSEYPKRINGFLSEFYSEKTPSGEALSPEEERVNDQIDQGLGILYQTFDLIAALTENVNPELTVGEALGFILRCASGQIREETSDDAADITGWLDARFAETPNLILVGLNEGIVPESRSSDIFLPDTVRTEIKIENNRRHYARDAYYLTTIVCRLTSDGKDGLRILFARAKSDGSPSPPSRLLFAEDETKIAERVARFFGGDRPGVSPEESELADYFAPKPPKADDARDTGSEAPAPFAFPTLTLPGDPPRGMNVTDFSSFLKSPYRYFLEKVFGLTTLGDAEPEIGFATFGTIAHEILRQFGLSELKDSTDDGEIKKYLSGELDRKVREYKKASAAGIVLLQLELIRRRLEGFARWQAAWRRAGNRIAVVEEKCEIELEGEKPYADAGAFPLTLTGKIDRIDYNEKRDQWFIFDYKTFDISENGAKNNENLAVRLNWLFPENEENRRTVETQEAEGVPAVNIKEGNKADQEHRESGQIIFPVELSDSGKHWKDLQLPLYTLLAEKIIREKGMPRGDQPLIPGYILLRKDNIAEANFPAWTEKEIADAILTARWVRQTIAGLWKGGKVDPNSPVDPKREESGKLHEPKTSFWNGKEKASWDILRDFPD